MEVTKREELLYMLGKYQRNIEQISPEDRKGRYHEPLKRFQLQIKTEAENYLKSLLLKDMVIQKDDEGWNMVSGINNVLVASLYGKRVGQALFRNFSLDEAEQITAEVRQAVWDKVYTPYFSSHTCLRSTAECWTENPQVPKFYNDLVGLFFDENTGKWYFDENEMKKDAICIYTKQFTNQAIAA